MRKSILNMVVISAAAIAGTAHAVAVTFSWVKIASQSASFNVNGPNRSVRFGNGSSWVTKSMTGAGQCTAAFFGKDPAPGVTKQCELFSASTEAAIPVSYNVKVNWTIPTTRQNGQALALSELKGYEVYYATDSNASTANDTVISISGGSVNTSTIGKLPAGTYYFSISAIDVNGLKSPLSTMVSTKVGG